MIPSPSLSNTLYDNSIRSMTPPAGNCHGFNISESNEDAKVLFRQLHKRALECGFTSNDFTKLEVLNEIPTTSILRKVLSIVSFFAFVIASLLVTSIFLSFPFSELWVISLFSRNNDVENEKCVINYNDFFQDFFQLPINCDVCRNVTEIKHITSLEPEKFEKLYAYTGVPVVITDALDNWTAVNNFSFHFFRDIYTVDATQSRANCQFFPYKTSFVDVYDVFNMSEERANMGPGTEPWYIGWSNCDPVIANSLRHHYSRPYFLPRHSESSKTDWIFMGTPGFGAHLHIDRVNNPSWQAQIKGKKRWVLEPPAECYDVCIPRLETILHPGHIVVVDTNRWYHSTQVLGDNISICIGSEYD